MVLTEIVVAQMLNIDYQNNEEAAEQLRKAVVEQAQAHVREIEKDGVSDEEKEKKEKLDNFISLLTKDGDETDEDFKKAKENLKFEVDIVKGKVRVGAATDNVYDIDVTDLVLTDDQKKKAEKAYNSAIDQYNTALKDAFNDRKLTLEEYKGLKKLTKDLAVGEIKDSLSSIDEAMDKNVKFYIAFNYKVGKGNKIIRRSYGLREEDNALEVIPGKAEKLTGLRKGLYESLIKKLKGKRNGAYVVVKSINFRDMAKTHEYMNELVLDTLVKSGSKVSNEWVTLTDEKETDGISYQYRFFVDDDDWNGEIQYPVFAQAVQRPIKRPEKGKNPYIAPHTKKWAMRQKNPGRN